MLLNGPESFTPDSNFILGEAPELANYFVCAGFNSMGIAIRRRRRRGCSPNGSSAASRRIDLWAVDIRRFAALQRQPTLAARPRQGNARPALRDALAEPRTGLPRGRSAARRSTTGSPPRAPCSAPRWAGSAPTISRQPQRAARDRLCRSAGRTGLLPWRGSSSATREAVALFDQTSFAKLLLQGRDALRRAAAAVRQRDGRARRQHRSTPAMLNAARRLSRAT